MEENQEQEQTPGYIYLSGKLKNNKLLVLFGASFLVPILMATFLTISLVRSCIGSSDHGLLRKLFCGDNLTSDFSAFRVLPPNYAKVSSNIPESWEFSQTKGLTANKIADGLRDTFAAPAASEIDYTLDLITVHDIRQVNIIWGDYGVNAAYIKEWTLEASGDDDNWLIVSKGVYPKKLNSLITSRFSARRLRLKAKSEGEWIGVYEVEITARPI